MNAADSFLIIVVDMSGTGTRLVAADLNIEDDRTGAFTVLFGQGQKLAGIPPGIGIIRSSWIGAGST